ncbi:class I SAM-dependent methyltransferase [Kribbella deserti]|uniref:Class I SAM-dependent methyltransferase n=1 Tax=Kribbella deserti TaxID=1926257 RepID=A0ABV6QIU3_9ACTN
MSTNPPNPYLAREISRIEPGTALDAGCGAGAEAIWLAAHGWQVTAADISAEALTQATTRAAALSQATTRAALPDHFDPAVGSAAPPDSLAVTVAPATGARTSAGGVATPGGDAGPGGRGTSGGGAGVGGVVVTEVPGHSAHRSREVAAAVSGDDQKAAWDGSGTVEWVEADLSVWEPGRQFDLVTTHYAHPAMPQLEFYDRIAEWVAPGGTLLIVGHLHTGSADASRHHGRPDSDHHTRSHAHHDHHDHHDHHGHVHGGGRHTHGAGGHGSGRHGHGDRGSDGHGHAEGQGHVGEVAVTAAAVVARLDEAEWEVLTAAEEQRTLAGHGGVLHDVVVRASRRHKPLRG